MNILSDYHHSDLFYSLQLLLEDRLGHKLFRPIGLDWYKEGFWNIYPSPDTAEQYLGMRQGYKPKDGTLPLNTVKAQAKVLDFMDVEGVYLCEDQHNGTLNTAITLEAFKKMDFDIVIASIPQHIKPFKELARMKGAKFIFQQGNMFSEILNNLHEIPNLLSSTSPFQVPPTCNAVFYHQEFDLDIFKPTSVLPERLISSFINVYHDNGGFEDYMTLKSIMEGLGYTFKSYGAQNQDGILSTTTEMANMMRRSMFGFHSKRMGDGFGHILYNLYACGVPVITRISDYKGKLGEELLTHRETCFDLDQLSYQELCDIIVNISPHEYDYMRQQAYNRFTQVVDYDAEEERVRKFLETLN